MAYPEQFIAPMRADLTQYGVEEARTPADVDRLLAPESDTVLMVDPSSPASTKVRAADSALDHGAKAIEIEDIEARLTELERAAELNQGGRR